MHYTNRTISCTLITCYTEFSVDSKPPSFFDIMSTKLQILTITCLTGCLAGTLSPAYAAAPGTTDKSILKEALLNLEPINQPVADRMPTELKQEGTKFGTFLVKPSLSISGKYDSNVRGLNQDEDEGYSLIFKPSLNIERKYLSHRVNAYIEGIAEKYDTLSSEDKNNVKTGMDGSLQMSKSWSMPFDAHYKKEARGRDAPQIQSITEEPEDIQTIHVSLGLKKQFNSLSLQLSPYYKSLKHDDGTALYGGADVIFSDDDRKDRGATLTAEYAFPRSAHENNAEHKAILDINYEQQKFDRGIYSGGAFTNTYADNDRYGALASFQSSYKGLLFSKVGLGYTKVEYDENSFEDSDLMTAKADISYMLTPKWQLGLNGHRKINTDNDFRQGIEDKFAQFKTEYEILHDTFLTGYAGYQLFDYIDNTREDERYTAGVDLRHINSANLESALQLGYLDRQSNQTNGADYDRYTVLLSLIGKI